MTDQLLPQLFGAQAEAIVDRAKALGLTWTLRPGTVNSTSATAPNVIYDGDTEPVGVVSLVGNLLPDSRVMMLQVPPAGNFVLGRLNTTGSSGVKQLATFRGEVASLADVILTTASQAITPLLTLNITSDAEYLITPNVDFDAFIAGGNNLCAATLQIDGVGLTDQIIFQENTSGVRNVLSKMWHGTLLAGSHTFQLIAVKSNATGGWATRAVGTSFVYQIFQ